jgi:hypothetical protein
MTKRCVAAALMAVYLCLPFAVSATECAPAGGEREVSIRLQAWFDAMAADDSKSWGQIIDPSFYAFDANKRLDGNALFDLVKSAHGAGIKIVWHLDQIDVHIDCTTAWFAMTNHGSVGDSSGTQTMTWQESGLFNYVQGQWMLRFFHSNRVQPQS